MNHSTTFLLLAIAVGLFAGGLLGAQPSVNGSLSKSVSHPLQASLISFGSGFAILLVLTLLFGGGLPPRFTIAPSALPWWIWMGGAIGVVLVTTSLLIVPRIGSLPWFAAVMTGQTIAALVLDHYGLLGNPKSPVSLLRVVGTTLLIVGVFVIVAAKQAEQRPVHVQQPDETTRATTSSHPEGLNEDDRSDPA